MAVLNLEGLQCRFDDPAEVLQEVAGSDTETATAILQRAYMTPIRDELVGLRVQEIKDGGVAAAVSVYSAERQATGFGDQGCSARRVRGAVHGDDCAALFAL